MKILYTICFDKSRDKERPYFNNIHDVITNCLISVVKQMDHKDEIIFFLDGNDPLDTINTICKKYNVNYIIKPFNNPVSKNLNKGCLMAQECVSYINENITNEQELIYLCEDDYLHYNGSLDIIKEFLLRYPFYFCHPIDYPNLYEEHLPQHHTNQYSEIIITKNRHWRSIKNSTMTFAFTKHAFDVPLNNLIFKSIIESTTDSVYDSHWQNLLFVFDKCFSPIPSLISHIEYGCVPYCIDHEKILNQST